MYCMIHYCNSNCMYMYSSNGQSTPLVVPESPWEIPNHVSGFGEASDLVERPKEWVNRCLIHIEEHNLLLLPMCLSMVGEHIGI